MPDTKLFPFNLSGKKAGRQISDISFSLQQNIKKLLTGKGALIIALVLLLLSCEKKDAFDMPVILTGNVTNITQEGALFSGCFRNVDPGLVSEYGIVFSQLENPLLKNSAKFSFPLPLKNEAYSYYENCSLKAGVKYFVRAYLIYDKQTYYGNVVSFISQGALAPVILSAEPELVRFGDTVIIHCVHASNDPAVLKVSFNEVEANILASTDSTIKVIFPLFNFKNIYYSTGKITVQVAKYEKFSTATGIIDLLPPEISSFRPDSALPHEYLYIKGNGFQINSTVYIGEYKCQVASKIVSDTSMVLYFPPAIGEYTGELRMLIGDKEIKSGNLTILGPRIDNPLPDTIFTADTIVFRGAHFNVNNLRVYINGVVASKIGVSDDSMLIKVPGGICGEHASLSFSYYESTFPEYMNFAFRQPEKAKTELTSESSGYKYYTVTGRYMPDVDLNENGYIDILGKEKSARLTSYTYSFDNDDPKIILNVPRNIGVGEWADLNVSFCEESALSVDSAIHIEPPVINQPSAPLVALKEGIISGENFDAYWSSNTLLLGENSFNNFSYVSSDQLKFMVPGDLNTGTYQMKVLSNGFTSNIVDINIENPWTKLSSGPLVIGATICFYNDKKIYIRDSLTSKLTVYDINANTWTNTGIEVPFTGGSVCDGQYAYIVFANLLFRYDIAANKLEQIASNPAGFQSPIPAFIYDNKIFIFPIWGIKEELYYYDLDTKLWIKYPGIGNIMNSEYPRTAVIHDMNNTLLINGNSVYRMNMNDLSFSYEGQTSTSIQDYSISVNSVVKDNIAYFTNEYSIIAVDLTTFQMKEYKMPGYAANLRIYLDGSTFYIICMDGIWSINIEDLL